MALPRGFGQKLKEFRASGLTPGDAMRRTWAHFRRKTGNGRERMLDVQRKRAAMRRGNPVSIPSSYYDRYEVETWFERDRAHVGLTDSKTGKDVLDLWDDDVQQLVEDGFLDSKDWHGSAIEYAIYLNLIPKPRKGRNPGAAWHEDQERMAEAMEKRETRPRQRTYLRGMADAHALSAHESRKMGLNPPVAVRYVTSRQVFEIKDRAGNVKRLSKAALGRLSPSMLNKALTYPNAWVELAWKNPRPSAIPAHKLAAANRYVNLIRNKKKRDYGFAYLSWLKGGAVGYEPEHPGLSVMGAQAVRLQLESLKLWENPRDRRSRRPKEERKQIRRFTEAIGRHGPKLAKALRWGKRRRPNPDVEMTFNTKAKAMRYASAMRKLGHDIEVVKGQYGTYKTIIREPLKNPIAVYNPPAGRMIYGQVLAVQARKTNGTYRGKNFQHKFAPASRVAMYALPDGSVLLKSGAGLRLWKDI